MPSITTPDPLAKAQEGALSEDTVSSTPVIVQGLSALPASVDHSFAHCKALGEQKFHHHNYSSMLQHTSVAGYVGITCFQLIFPLLQGGISPTGVIAATGMLVGLKSFLFAVDKHLKRTVVKGLANDTIALGTLRRRQFGIDTLQEGRTIPSVDYFSEEENVEFSTAVLGVCQRLQQSYSWPSKKDIDNEELHLGRERSVFNSLELLDTFNLLFSFHFCRGIRLAEAGASQQDEEVKKTYYELSVESFYQAFRAEYLVQKVRNQMARMLNY